MSFNLFKNNVIYELFTYKYIVSRVFATSPGDLVWHDGDHSFCGCGCGWAPVRGYEEMQGHRAEHIGVIDSQGKATVRESRLLKEVLWLVDLEARSASARGWVSVPGSFVGISFGYTLAIASECQKSAKTSPLLRLGLTQVRACLFFFLPLSVIYIISVIYL